MSRRIAIGINLLLLTLLIPLAAPAPAAPLADDGTEDILYMNDGRELHGQILEEKKDSVVFQLVHRGSGIETKVTYLLDEIDHIKRDVEFIDDAPTRPRRATSRPGDDDEEPERTFGARRTDNSDNADIPSFYLIPMKGQMGTDVNTEVYERMMKDIRAANPDFLIIKLDCKDEDDALYSLIGREEQGLPDFDEYRKLINLFRDELRDIRQVMWVQDSVGVSSVIALGWEEMYMHPKGRLGGMRVLQNLGFEKWADKDVRGKMTAAFMSWVKGFLEYGGYSLVLADAMVRPQFSLSGTWKGREVEWRLNESGEYLVDNSDEATVSFRAKSAEDLCISSGTAETLDDLSLLLGIREYRVLEGRADDIFDDHSEEWRRALENCIEWYQDFQQFQGWASGEDTVKYLGQAKGRLEKILAAIERYDAVETRIGQYGIRKFDIETQIEVIKERLRSLRKGQRGGAGGGRGPTGRGGGNGRRR